MKKITILALVAGLFFAACSKDFLDTDSTRFMSKDDIDKVSEDSPHLMIATLNGLYATMVKVGSGGTTGHDDFGQKGMDIYMDMLCADMVLNGVNYGWYSDIADLTAPVDYTSNPNYVPWRYYYYLIRGTNNVITALGDENGEATNEANRFPLGQAKAIRAHAYFYLTQLYTAGYDANEKKLPIYDKPTLNNQPPVNTQDVFAFMIKDLKDAINLLEGYSGAKSTVNKEIAQGILAYVLAAKGTSDALTQVVTLTQDVINSGKYPLTTKEQLTGGFNNLATSSWMWGADITLENGLDLISWWGQVDLFTYSYAMAGDPKGMDEGLYAKIKADDERKNQFEVDEDVIWPFNKFYAPARTVGGQRLIETDYIYMRVDEMYLLNAEAHARLNSDGPAIDRLKELLENRIIDLSYLDGLSGQALKDEIYLQTRIELWGEGKSYLAMKRNKETVTRGMNHLFLEGQSLNYDDPRMTMSVPQAEVLNNPHY